MGDAPKLTAAEYGYLRSLTEEIRLDMMKVHHLCDFSHGLDYITPKGRAALEAYDAEQRERILREELAKVLSYRMEGLPKDREFHTSMDDVLNDQRKAIKAIRVEAMREVHDMIRTTRNAHVDRHLRGIEVMIAKEEA